MTPYKRNFSFYQAYAKNVEVPKAFLCFELKGGSKREGDYYHKTVSNRVKMKRITPFTRLLSKKMNNI